MMPTDIEQMLTDSLDARAAGGSPIDPAPLLRAVVGRGERRRGRRRLAGAVVVAVAVVAATVGVNAIGRPPVEKQPSLDGDNGTAPAYVNLAKLTAPAEVPGAINAPDLVGTDPLVIHLNVDDLASKARLATWRSTGTYESANVWRSDLSTYVAVARDRNALPPADSPSATYPSMADPPTRSAPSPVLIGGIAGEATSWVGKDRGSAGPKIWQWSLIWQPVAGLWATVEVQTTSLDDAVRVAGQVRFDRATRCAVPFRVQTQPAGSTLRACDITLAGDGDHLFQSATLRFGDGTKGMELTASYASPGSGEYPRPLRAGPNQLYPDPNGTRYTMLLKPIFFDFGLVGPKTGYTRADVLELLGSVRLAGTISDPSTYP